MKKQILSSLFLLSSILTMNAQWNGNNPLWTNSNVGIGVPNPIKKLEVATNTATGEFRLRPADGLYQDYRLDIVATASEIGAVKMSIKDNVFLKTYGYYFLSGLSLGVAGYEDLFHLKNNGNVGIGTTVPSDKLSVSAGAITVGFGNMDKATLQGGSGFGSLLRLYYADGTETVRLDAGGGGGTSWINGGNVLIGKTSQLNSAYKLDVNGTIRSNEIKVNLDGADFVFEKDYKLMSLFELEKFVKDKKHLPEVAPANEMEKNGTNLGVLTSKLLQKIEELTLYTIEQNKELKSLKKKILKLESKKR